MTKHGPIVATHHWFYDRIQNHVPVPPYATSIVLHWKFSFATVETCDIDWKCDLPEGVVVLGVEICDEKRSGSLHLKNDESMRLYRELDKAFEMPRFAQDIEITVEVGHAVRIVSDGMLGVRDDTNQPVSKALHKTGG